MPLTLRTSLFRPGQRVAVAVSAGLDSVALLRRLLEERPRLGIVLSVVHVHHRIRHEAEEEAAFVASLAAAHDLPFHLYRIDVPASAAALHQTLEEAARNQRYACFRQLMDDGLADMVATAHTLDDQAETVLHKLLRGAWTEGLSGIHPVMALGPGNIVRPFLENTHAALQAWLLEIRQPWREDASNQDLKHTRNRIRWELLPLLRTFNPQIAGQLSRLASIAGDEETYWQGELDRLLPLLLLPGRPTRGGGRSASTLAEQQTVGIEVARLREMQPAVARRILRAAARRLDARLSFEHTEKLLAMVDREPGRSARLDLPDGVTVERSLREIRLTRGSAVPARGQELAFAIPGEVDAPEYGLRLRADAVTAATATLRNWKAGDRVTLRHARSPKKVAEVLDRLHVIGQARVSWPVVESGGKIVWMRGVEVDAPGFSFTAVT